MAIPGSNRAGFGSGMGSGPGRTCLGTRQGTLGLGIWVWRRRRRASPGSGAQGPRGGLQALVSHAKERGGGDGPHHGPNRAEMKRSGVGGEVRRRGVDRCSRWRALLGSKSRKEISRRILAPRRSSCGACQGLGDGGAAWPRRQDALLRAEARRSGYGLGAVLRGEDVGSGVAGGRLKGRRGSRDAAAEGDPRQFHR